MDKTRTSELAAHARERSNIYGFLSLVYGEEPSGEFVREIKADEFASVLQELGVVFDAVFEIKDQERLVEKLAVEYNRLYVGPGKHIPPFESVYVDPGRRNGQLGLMQGKPAAFMDQAFERLGLKLSKRFKGMSDHIAAELALMRFLAEEESQAWEAGDMEKGTGLLAAQKRFLDDHLARWVPEFCDRASRSAKLKFYETLAGLTKDFVLSEQATIPETMEAVAKSGV